MTVDTLHSGEPALTKAVFLLTWALYLALLAWGTWIAFNPAQLGAA